MSKAAYIRRVPWEMAEFTLRLSMRANSACAILDLAHDGGQNPKAREHACSRTSSSRTVPCTPHRRPADAAAAVAVAVRGGGAGRRQQRAP